MNTPVPPSAIRQSSLDDLHARLAAATDPREVEEIRIRLAERAAESSRLAAEKARAISAMRAPLFRTLEERKCAIQLLELAARRRPTYVEMAAKIPQIVDRLLSNEETPGDGANMLALFQWPHTAMWHAERVVVEIDRWMAAQQKKIERLGATAREYAAANHLNHLLPPDLASEPD